MSEDIDLVVSFNPRDRFVSCDIGTSTEIRCRKYLQSGLMMRIQTGACAKVTQKKLSGRTEKSNSQICWLYAWTGAFCRSWGSEQN